MKKLFLLAAITLVIVGCKKDNKEFTKEIYTPGDGISKILYSEINADKIFRGKKPKTNYKTAVYVSVNNEWQAVDVNNYAGGQIILTIDQSTGDLEINFNFAPFGSSQRFKFVITK